MNTQNLFQLRVWVALFAIALGLGFPCLSHAHFIWVYQGHDGTVKIVFGEGLKPDQAQFLDGLSAMKVYSVLSDGSATEVNAERKTADSEGWFEIDSTKSGNSIDVECLYGMFGRGESQMLLNYGAKYINYDGKTSNQTSGKLPLDIIPSMKDGKLVFHTFFDGKPAEGVELTIYQLETDDVVANTNKDGQFVFEAPARFVVRAKHTVAKNGTHQGQAYGEQRYYCTLVLDMHHSSGSHTAASSEKSSHDASSQFVIKKTDEQLPDLPIGLTSFGGAVSSDQIFVIGGKEGKAHDYAKSYQNRQLMGVDTRSGNQWVKRSESEGLQGLALIAHGKNLYRIGGLDARNAEGEDHDLHSVDSFCEYDTTLGKWKDLPNMPQGRSSFDACLVGDTIYVVGGWTMKGEDDSEWCTDTLTYNLAKKDSKWESIDTPFTARALAVRELNGKVYAIGGIDESQPTGKVHVLDLKTNQWTEGPAIPAKGGMKAFGCSAVVVDGQLLVSTYDGGVYQLDETQQVWNKIHELENGRFFHQMLPLSDSRFALVGGAHMEIGKIFETEVYQCHKAEGEKK